MKILSFMNVSNKEKLSTDSGYVFYNTLADALIAAGHKFTFVGPAPLKCPDAGYYDMDFGRNKYEVRFQFGMHEVAEILLEEEPDIIIANQMELIPHFHVCLERMGNTHTRIVGYAHYIPYDIDFNGYLLEDPSLNARGLNPAIIHAFISGVEMADRIFVHSETALKLIEDGCKAVRRPFDRSRFVLAPPPRDPALVCSDIEMPSSNTAIYNHRLYAHYGTEEIIELIPELVALGVDVKVLDILGERTPERRKLDPTPDLYRKRLKEMEGVTLTTEGTDREKYRQLLQGARFGLAPVRQNCPWAMSCVDCMGMGKPVIAPNIAWFREGIPRQLLYETRSQAVGIAYRLMSDDEFYLKMAHASKEATDALTPQVIAGKFLATFETLMSQKYEPRHPDDPGRFDISLGQH